MHQAEAGDGDLQKHCFAVVSCRRGTRAFPRRPAEGDRRPCSRLVGLDAESEGRTRTGGRLQTDGAQNYSEPGRTTRAGLAHTDLHGAQSRTQEHPTKRAPTAILKFTIIFNKGPQILIFHQALQVMQPLFRR